MLMAVISHNYHNEQIKCHVQRGDRIAIGSADKDIIHRKRKTNYLQEGQDSYPAAVDFNCKAVWSDKEVSGG
jgi:hypothetical protein